MKVIFLDIDGVLNVEVFINAFWECCRLMKLARPEAAALRLEMMQDEYGNLFCPTATRNLAWLIEATGAKIVISSTWRLNGLHVMQSMWKHRGLPGEVIDVTPRIVMAREDKQREATFAERTERGFEIDHWLKNHPEVESFVIFDDDNDMLDGQKQRFIQTDERYGITFKDVENAINILNS